MGGRGWGVLLLQLQATYLSPLPLLGDMLLCQPQFTGVLCPQPSFQAAFMHNPSCWYQLQGLCARCSLVSLFSTCLASIHSSLNQPRPNLLKCFWSPWCLVHKWRMAGLDQLLSSILVWSCCGFIYCFLSSARFSASVVPWRLKLKPGTCMDMAESLDNIKHTGPKVVTMYDNDSFTFMQSTIANL